MSLGSHVHSRYIMKHRYTEREARRTIYGATGHTLMLTSKNLVTSPRIAIIYAGEGERRARESPYI